MEIINCKCGCGRILNKYDSSGRERKFISGHNSKLESYKEIHRKRLSGKPSFFKGKKHTIESIKKMSKSHMEIIPYNKGTKGLMKPNKTSFKKGHIPSYKGTKGLMKQNKTSFKTGLIPWNKGKTGFHFSKETEFKKGHSPWHKGKHGVYSEERMAKLKEERARRIMPKKDTKIEVKVQNYLKDLGIDFFTHQYIKDIEHGYQCDILIPSLNLVIEIDGDYWHKYPIGTEIDHIRTKELLEKGFKVLRLWEFEIKEMSIDKFKEKLK